MNGTDAGMSGGLLSGSTYDLKQGAGRPKQAFDWVRR
jgi:hypothetical protein